MALVLPTASSTASADPTETLRTALTNFEIALTAEQRQHFNDQVKNSRQQKPDASTVIQFTAEIDAANHNKTRTSVSGRLCTFLDAAQRFTGIVDTFVSSNPAVAALVWGGIKTAVLVASNVVAYFDKVTTMIMTIGRICPAFREFSYLYKTSVDLQKSVCEYYAVVIELMTEVVRIPQRGGFLASFSAIFVSFESEFSGFQQRLKDHADLVQLQVSIAAGQAARASARLMEYESKANARHRSLLKTFTSTSQVEQRAIQDLRLQEAARRAAKTRQSIQDRLSTINEQISWRQAKRQRLAETAEWFRNEQQFEAWLTDTRAATLWCPGRMGVGKTVLASNIISHLHSIFSSHASDIVAYHFCRSDDAATLTARNVIGTLARQMLHKYIEDVTVDQLRSLENACQHLDTNDVIDLLSSHLQVDTSYYLIIDGLDECETREITVVATSIAKLLEVSDIRIKILCSGRPELEHQLYRETTPKYRLPISKNSVDADIHRYIDSELERCLEDNTFKLANAEAILEIRDTLYSMHDGLLLFVRLFVEELCMLGSEHAIMAVLDKPPRKISDLLAKRITRIQGHHLALDATKMLRYCGGLRRPLTVDEFSELLSIDVSQKSLNRSKVPQNMDQIITACGGLIYVEEEDRTIHYVHQCVRYHLFTDTDPVTLRTAYDAGELDLHLGRLCLTYLNFNDFERQLQKMEVKTPMVVAPIDIGLASVRIPGSNTVNQMARKLLKTRPFLQHSTPADLSRMRDKVLGDTESVRLTAEMQRRTYSLLSYVQVYWVWHLPMLNDTSSMWSRFCASARGENKLAKRPWAPDGGDDNVTSEAESSLTTSVVIRWAFRHNHPALLLSEVMRDPAKLVFIEWLLVMVQALKSRCHRLLAYLARARTTGVAELCLIIAADQGLVEVVDLFIDAGANVSVNERLLMRRLNKKQYSALKSLYSEAGIRYETIEAESALSAAVNRGHLQIVERLLTAEADVDIRRKYEPNLLRLAAREGHSEIVSRLLVAVGSSDAGNTSRIEALAAASFRGHLDVVERLLAAGVNVNANAPGMRGDTALLRATAGGHLLLVESLLRAGAHIDGSVDYGRTALHVAVQYFHLSIAEKLIAAGADVNRCDDSKMTALQFAVYSRRLSIVERLLEAGADVNITGGPYGSALFIAADKDYLEIVKRLLIAGAQVRASIIPGSVDRYNALGAAVFRGHLDIVDQLLAAGADVNATVHYDDRRETVLQLAKRLGNPEMVQRLEAVGARK